MRTLLAATATAILALIGAPAAGADGPYDYAVGAGDRGTFAGVSVHHFALSAHDGPNGPIGQYISRTDLNPIFTFNGDATCLFVLGNRAVVGGEITKRAAPEFQQNGFMVAFEDNGPPAGGVTTDRISLIDLQRPTPPTQADCAAEGLAFFGLFRPMLSGNVTIYDAP